MCAGWITTTPSITTFIITTQNNNTQLNKIQHNGSVVVPNAVNKPFMLGVVMLDVIMLNVVLLSVVAP